MCVGGLKGESLVLYILSKTIWFVIAPSNFLVLIGIIGVVLLFTKRQKLAKTLVVLSISGVAILGLSPVGFMLLTPLEDRFERPSSLEGIEGIIVLGGSFDTLTGTGRGTVEFNEAPERLITAVNLAKQNPHLRVVFSGGGKALIHAGKSESEIARQYFGENGILLKRVELEDQSQNTAQNARFTRELIEPEEGERWLVVTSAFHMPRAMGSFHAVGWEDVVAYPVDYRTRGPEDQSRFFNEISRGLRRVDLAVKEYVGLLAYYVFGRSAELFPAQK